MSDPTIAVFSVLGTLAVLLVLLAAIIGGNFGRLGLAWSAFVRTARDPAFADKVHALVNPPPPEPPKPPKPNPEPLRILALLQRDGRFIDFLMTENIQAADDNQIAAALKELQPKWMATLTKHLDLTPVMPQPENSQVEVPPGFDPSAIRVIGNVTGQPPFRGTLIHAGWRVREIRVPPPPEGQDEFVLQPAEVELP
jgi:hypothetical protein